MNTIIDTVTELLMEVSDICDKADIKYAVIGKAAENIKINKCLMPSDVEPVVVMTGTDLIKFIGSLEVSKEPARAMEYFGTNKEARSLSAKYVNRDTTYIRLNDNNQYKEKAIGIRIEPLRTARSLADENLEIGLLCQNSKIRAYSSKSRLKAYNKVKKSLKKSDSYVEKIFEKLCLGEGSSKDGENKEAYIRDDFNKVKIEAELLNNAEEYDFGNSKIKLINTRPLNHESDEISRELVISAEIKYEDYIRRCESENIGLDQIKKLQKKSKTWRMITKKEDKLMDKSWDKVLLSGDRMNLLEYYQPRLEEIKKLWEAGNKQQVEELMKPHEEAVIRNLSKGLGLMVHPILSQIQYEMFCERGQCDIKAKIEKSIPKAHRQAINLEK